MCTYSHCRLKAFTASYRVAGADPGFEKGGSAVGSGARYQYFLANLRDFLKNLGQKGVVVRPPPSGSAPEWASIDTILVNTLCADV